MSAAAQAAERAAERAAREGYGRLVALLAARTGGVAAAEDALSEAFAAALAVWPQEGVPASPEAWLVAVAARRAVDAHRRGRTRDAAAAELVRIAEERAEGPGDDGGIPDERLRLLLACAHPAVDPGVRAPLMLQVVLGLDAARIAAAFLVSPAAMAQRLVRAKRRIEAAGAAFELPERAEMPGRVGAVLDAVYVAATEGWADPAGADPAAAALAGEARWLAGLVADLLPDDAEAQGLAALVLHLAARRGARRTPDGRYVPLSEQDPALWDAGLVEAAEARLRAASRLGRIGRYQLEAAVQSAHAARRITGAVDRAAVVQLYDALVALTGSPVAATNRAAALAELRGPAEGLAALDAASQRDRRLADYQPWWAARAEMLARLGRGEEARAAFDQAIGRAADPAVRAFLAERRSAAG